jgi:hypothetical protein
MDSDREHKSASLNRQLITWVIGLFLTAFFLVEGVVIYDRRDSVFGIVDHLFDFHINEDAIRNEHEKRNREETDHKRQDKNRETWSKDVRDWYKSPPAFEGNGPMSDDSRSGTEERGTVGQSDRD